MQRFNKGYNEEEALIHNAIVSAREIQEFLWGNFNDKAASLEEWKRMLRKRVAKVDEIEVSNPHYKVELRKRLLQTAAVSISLLRRLNADNDHVLTSNLPRYANPKEGL